MSCSSFRWKNSSSSRGGGGTLGGFGTSFDFRAPSVTWSATFCSGCVAAKAFGRPSSTTCSSGFLVGLIRTGFVTASNCGFVEGFTVTVSFGDQCRCPCLLVALSASGDLCRCRCRCLRVAFSATGDLCQRRCLRVALSAALFRFGIVTATVTRFLALSVWFEL